MKIHEHPSFVDHVLGKLTDLHSSIAMFVYGVPPGWLSISKETGGDSHFGLRQPLASVGPVGRWIQRGVRLARLLVVPASMCIDDHNHNRKSPAWVILFHSYPLIEWPNRYDSYLVIVQQLIPRRKHQRNIRDIDLQQLPIHHPATLKMFRIKSGTTTQSSHNQSLNSPRATVNQISNHKAFPV